MNQQMFCFQCEQTAGCTGCTGKAGVCGKSADVANLQDRLTGALIGLARATDGGTKSTPSTWRLMIEGLFATITNVNFNEASLDELVDRVHRERDALAQGCASCSEPCGRTGDYDLHKLWNADEDIRSLKSLVLFGIRGVAAYAYHAMALGYDFCAATAPFYYGFGPKEVCDYYYAIAEAAGAPVLIYNFPGNTHRQFDVADPDYIALFRSGAILGVKQTNYDLFQMERILNLNPDLIAFDGYDETMVAGQALGAIGSIGSTFNMMLPHYKKIFTMFEAGDRAGALALQHKANNCMQAMCRVGLIPAIKYELARQGYPVGEARAPFRPLTDEQKAYVDAVLDRDLVTA